MIARGTYRLDAGRLVGEDGTLLLAEMDLPPAGTPRVERVDGTGGRPFDVVPYGRGWQLCARAPGDPEDVLLWYRPRAIRSGGTIEMADGTAYDVRSSPLKRLDLRVREGGKRLVEVTARPYRGGRAEILVDVNASPTRAEHAPTLVAFLAVLGTLVYREGKLQRSHGFDGPA